MLSTLTIQNLELSVHFGWSDEEQSQKQTITLDIEIELETPPAACKTDHLKDTFCYAHLITLLQVKAAEKNYRLLEHFTHEFYDFIKKHIPKNSKVMLHVTKQPLIQQFSGQVSFSYGDKIAS